MAGKKTVMICDDEEDLLQVYSTALKPKFEVITTNSGKNCLQEYMEQKISGRKIHVLLLDYRLGDMSGDDVACKIRDLNGTRTILVTAYEIEHQKVKELKQKQCIVDMMRKPVTMGYLVEKVQEVASQ